MTGAAVFVVLMFAYFSLWIWLLWVELYRFRVRLDRATRGLVQAERHIARLTLNQVRDRR